MISGPTAEPPPDGVKLVKVETAEQMLKAAQAALPVDIAVCAAAVADWGVANPAPGKIKKGADGAAPAIALVENPDILATLSKAAVRPRLVVGFAAETGQVETYAQAKLARKGCDWIVANDVSVEGTMGGDDNAVAIVSAGGIERWERMAKGEVARRLADRIAAAFN